MPDYAPWFGVAIMGLGPSHPEEAIALGGLPDVELFALLPPKKGKEGAPEEQPVTPHVTEEDEKGKQLSPGARRALDELWARHHPAVRAFLKAKVFERGSTLCPPQEPSKEHFLDMSMNEAYI